MATARGLGTLFLLFFSLHFFSPPSSVSAEEIGICYGREANNLPSPGVVVQLLKKNGINKVRLYNSAPSILKAFSGTGIDLMIGVPNEILPTLNSSAAASAWLKSDILPYVSPDQIRYLAVGNEILVKEPHYAPFLLPALTALHAALHAMTLGPAIKLSTVHAAEVVSGLHHPSAAVFHADALHFIKPLLQFLSETESPFMVNLYPFDAHVAEPERVPLAFATFGVADPVRDGPLLYENQFDIAVDAVVAALERNGFGDLPVVVTETGWPTKGGNGAGKAEAEAYNDCVARRVLNGVGTPRRPGLPLEVFLFELFDENQKGGAEYRKHFGIFGVDGVKAYNVTFA